VCGAFGGKIMRRGRYVIIVVAVILTYTCYSLAGGQARRKPVTISADSTLPLRILVRPLSHIYKAKDSSEIVKENVPTFQAYYVYTYPENEITDTQGWYEIGSNDRGEVLGWMRADDVIDWKQTMSLAYTHPEGRQQVLMFAQHDYLRELVRLPAQQRNQRVQQLYTKIEAGKAIPPDFPVVSVEPKRMIDINKEFYLLPIIDFEVLKAIDGKREGRLVKLAAAAAFGPAVRDTSDIRANPQYLQEATTAATTVDLQTLQGLQADIVFVMDTTISMRPYIDGVRATIREGIRYVSKQAATNASLRFGVWGYRDDPQRTPGIEYNTKNYTPTLQPIEEFERTLGQVKEARVSDPDYPEDVFSGVHKALTATKWRDGALHFLLLIGDAPSHELGHPQNLSGQDENTLRSYASDQKVSIMAFYLKNPSYVRYHELAARQFRKLADNLGVTKGPTYSDSISTGDIEGFRHHLRGVFEELVKLVAQAKRGQVPPPAPEEKSPKSIAADMGYAALVQWIGSKTGTTAPRDITAWAVDKDLVDFNIQAMDVRVLLNKRQLDSLKTILSDVIAAGRRGRIGGEAFFTALQAVSATAVRDPDQLKNARSFADTRLIPDFLQGLPYTSPLMAMTNELWRAWSLDDQDQFLRTLEAKNEYYVTVHDTQEGWIRLNRQDDPDQAVFPVLLEMLP
jgi:serine/threonine-protein kinase PpkA